MRMMKTTLCGDVGHDTQDDKNDKDDVVRLCRTQQPKKTMTTMLCGDVSQDNQYADDDVVR